eukprot:883977-Pleurochrysis_carterae.AAC.2
MARSGAFSRESEGACVSMQYRCATALPLPSLLCAHCARTSFRPYAPASKQCGSLLPSRRFQHPAAEAVQANASLRSGPLSTVIKHLELAKDTAVQACHAAVAVMLSDCAA